jgi:hypothetical protein
LGGSRAIQSIVRTRAAFWLAIAYIIFAFVVRMAIRVPDLGGLIPHWILQAFDPNDKTNLAPYRVDHFKALAVVVTQFLQLDSPILQWRAGLADQVWPALASGLLHRHRPLVLRPCGDRTEPEFVLGSECVTKVGGNAAWRRRHSRSCSRRACNSSTLTPDAPG